MIFHALLWVFVALYFDQNKNRKKQEPKAGLIDFWGDSGLICHIPHWVILRYSFVKDNYHYILRPEIIPLDIPDLICKSVQSRYGYYDDNYYGLSFDLPEYISFPYSGPDDPFIPAKVDQDQLLTEEEIEVKKERRLKVA